MAGERMVDGGPWENATVTKQLKMTCDAPEYSPPEIVEAIYRWVGEDWLPRGFNYFEPLPESRITFIDTDDEDNRKTHLFEIICVDESHSPPWVDPLLVTDRGMVVQKDFTAGGFIGTNQGEIWIGHGRNNSTDVPKLVLMHTSPFYTNPEYDTLFLTKADCATPANLNLENVIVGNSDTISKQENMVKYSQDFSNGVWEGYCGTKNNIIQNTSDVLAPDGTQTAAKIVMPSVLSCGASTCWGCLQYVSPSLQVSETYTVSIWLRGVAGGELVKIGLNDPYGSTVTLTNQWKRYTYTKTIPAGGYTSRGLQFFGQTASSNYYVWGAQLENDTSAHMYTPTTSAAMINRLALKSKTGVTAILNSTGQLGTLDAGNVFVDHLNSASAGGIYIMDTLKPYGSAINVSGALSSDSVIHGGGNNGDAFKVGDDIYLRDINVENAVSFQGAQNRYNARLYLGSGNDVYIEHGGYNTLYVYRNVEPGAGTETGYLGEGGRYWYGLVSKYVYYKYLSQFYDEYDDLSIAKLWGEKNQTLPEDYDRTKLKPPSDDPFKIIKGSKEEANTEEFFDAGKVSGFLMSCVKALAKKQDEHDALLLKLLNEVESLRAEIAS
jgi:hypothetical protein